MYKGGRKPLLYISIICHCWGKDLKSKGLISNRWNLDLKSRFQNILEHRAVQTLFAHRVFLAQHANNAKPRYT
jgi:hypothetical protein